MYKYIITIIGLLSCNINSGSAVITSPNDTSWVVTTNNNITKKTLIVKTIKVQDLYYTRDKVDSFFINDQACGEARLTNNQNKLAKTQDSTFYLGCSYTEDISHLQTIDSVYSFYLPEQKTLDSFNFTLWAPIEKEKQYDFTIYANNSIAFKGTQNSPIVKITLPYIRANNETTYFIRKTIQNKGKIYQTSPMPLFKEINGKIKFLNQ